LHRSPRVLDRLWGQLAYRLRSTYCASLQQRR
jgi:hypothetical protein